MSYVKAIILVAMLAIGLGSCSTVANGPDSGVDVIDSFGLWTLSDLGYSDIVLEGDDEVETCSIQYRLPKDAAQGPDNWYILHLDFNIHFSEQTDEGFCILSADTNTYTCAQIQFKVQRDDDSLLINWNTLGLIDGSVDHISRSLDIDGSFRNYLRSAGIRPDLSTLSFRLETYEGAKVKRLEILDSSGIECTSVAPPKLEMSIRVPENSIEVGTNFAVEFKLNNEGGWSVEDAVVQVIYPETRLELLGNDTIHIPDVGESAMNMFEFKALKEESSEIAIQVSTKSGVPPAQKATLAVLVGETTGSPSAVVPVIPIILGSIGVGLISFGAWRVGRFRRPSHG